MSRLTANSRRSAAPSRMSRQFNGPPAWNDLTIALVQGPLDVAGLITHRIGVDDYT